MTSIFLKNTDNGEKYVPAPLYYWKVLHDPKSNTSAAFIGLNNPHATERPKELCTNVCSSMKWVDWSTTELDAGYMYCCSVEDARKEFPSMPDLKTKGLIQQESSELIDAGSCTAGPSPTTDSTPASASAMGSRSRSRIRKERKTQR